ncbi:ABC transporter permease [Photobacterium damselae subsp. damselae]|uniref:ABC transporter permease n=1 Tax=Photobacterium damselae TaxID=38293 RepID=UPI001AF11693|nr:ABC transporter permease [Photobacterium damselae]QSH57985.1 ABC transporter permease [Photobacterium damselae subsp. damselae]
MTNALKDIWLSLKQWELWTTLGWLELRQRYKRSIVGPFWITLSMGILILALGIIYGELFKMELKTYLPMLAIGLVFWTFMSNVINEGATSFISSSTYISQLPTTKFIYILQAFWRNLMMLCHNIVIVLAVLVYFDTLSLNSVPLFFIGFIIVVINLIWVSLLLAILSVRFRDIPQIVTSIMQVVRFEALKERAKIVVLSSHDNSVILNSCNKVLWMEAGEMKMLGTPSDVLNSYMGSVI